MPDEWDQYIVKPQKDEWEQYVTAPEESSSINTAVNESPANMFQNFLNGQTIQDVNPMISQRPSILKDALVNPIDAKQHPFQRPLQDIAAGFEVLEGIPSSIALDIQSGKTKDIIPNIGKVLSGQRPAQRGDIMRAIGVPEPLAATIGLISGMAGGGGTSKVSKLASISKLLPENIALSMLAKAGSVAAKVSGLKSLVQNYGKPAIARTLSILSQVPKEKVEQAINNPNFLSRRFLNQERESVQGAYKKVIQPLIEDSSKRIDLTGLDVNDLGLVNASGEPTKVWESMTRTEQAKVMRWTQKIFSTKGDFSFNAVDGLKGQMDEALDSVYRKEAKGIPVDYSNDFIRVTRQLRDKVNGAVTKQYPKVGEVLNRYADYKSGELLYKSFEMYHPHLWQGLISAGITTTKPSIGLTIAASTIPKVQALGIRGSAFGNEILRQSGSAIPEAFFDQYRQSLSKNQ